MSDSISYFVYGKEAIMLYQKNLRIIFRNNLIKSEKWLEAFSDWNNDPSYINTYKNTIHELVPYKWNHITITKQNEDICNYNVSVNGKSSFCIQYKNISYLQFGSSNNNPTYWKIEQVKDSEKTCYWKTDVELEDVMLLPFKITATYKTLCVSVMVQMCVGCEMYIGLYSSDDDIIADQVML